MTTRNITILFSCSLLFWRLPFAAANTATAAATSLSVYEEPVAWFIPGIGSVTTFFTTFDGASGLPLFDTASASFSGELRPRAGQPGTYEGDYLNANTSGVLAYGFGTLTLPANDLDGNGIPDIFQFDQSGVVSYTGTIQSDYPSVVKYITRGTLSKSRGDYSIANAFTASDPFGVVQSFTGTISIGYFSGILNYTRGSGAIANQLVMTLTGVLVDPIPVTYTGSVAYSIIGQNEISIPQFTARRADGRTIQILPMTLIRKGNKYLGGFEISDGDLSTSWRDYTKWILEVIDTNDSDANGIPDLSDALNAPPIITSQPQSLSVVNGGSLSFSVFASGEPAPTYQWQFNDTNISGATDSFLQLTNIQNNEGGKYRVIVSNRSGNVISSEATLTVLPIVLPKLTIVSEGNGKVRVFWPLSFTNYILESNPEVSVTSWSPILESPQQLRGLFLLSFTADQRARTFRLRQDHP